MHVLEGGRKPGSRETLAVWLVDLHYKNVLACNCKRNNPRSLYSGSKSGERGKEGVSSTHAVLNFWTVVK